ncbi:hypothetical protein F4825DRAFT_296726 [Nemania diffusa]|nr:hypothetical protein F4825DRAFT_296726 [Nemania diffusa]
MNWTEGSLARHSRRRQRNTLIARQKQHFANARRNLLNGQVKQGPTTISFLTSRLISESPGRAASSRNYQDAPPTPLLSLKRKREPRREYPPYLPEDGHGAVPTHLDRRKRLLEKSDWAGLRLQEPLDISFPGQVYATKRWTRVAQPPERTPNSPGKDVLAHREGRFKPLRRSSMIIQIGDQEIHPSIASGSHSSINQCTLESKRLSQSSRDGLVLEDSRYTQSSEHERFAYNSIYSDEDLRISPTSLGNPETPVNVIYSSSIIREPAPRRNGNFPVLQWSPASSEDGESMRVEIERPIRPVPPSQESEQRRWKDWILGEDSSNLLLNNSLAAMNTSETCTEELESSALILPSHLQPQLPSLSLSSEADPAPKQTSSEHSSIEGITDICDISHDSRCSPDNHNLPLCHQQRTPKKKKEDLVNLNNIWMKSACGDDENSEELLADAFKKAAHQAAVELRPSDTSGSVDEHAKTIATCAAKLSCIDNQLKYNSEPPETSSESHMATIGTTVSGAASSNIATAGSSDQSLFETKRFIKPKAFIGKHANTDQASIDRDFVGNFSGNKNKGKGKGKRRRKKMATDGRTDIRNLPDFDGDPIEEIEDN